MRHENMGQFCKLSDDTVPPNVDESSEVTLTLASADSNVSASELDDSISTAEDSNASNSTASSSTTPISVEKKNERFDGFNEAHWPFHDDKKSQSRCKLKGWNGLTHVYCDKCTAGGKMVHLCFTKGRNCFYNYHNPNH